MLVPLIGLDGENMDSIMMPTTSITRATYNSAELQEITGLEQPAAQERFLTKLGLRVFRNASNEVVLEREVFRRWQLGLKMALDQQEPRLKSIHG